MGGYRHLLFTGASVLTLVVAGCMDSSEKAGDSAGEATAFSERPASGRLVERDVEAPEVFQATDQGLWDGRPSLGGVWVAYPDVSDPERVIIRNESNGKFVIGALFKRERENPGPRLQVSSDAAAALGMLAGSPTTLNVTALRREEPAPKTAAPAEAAPAAAVADATVEDTADEAIAGAAAALARTETGETADGAAAIAAPAVASATEAVDPAPKKSWNPFRRQPKDAGEAEAAAIDVAIEDAAGLPPAETADAVIPSETAPQTAETAADAEGAATGVEMQPATAKRGWNPFRRKPKTEVAPDAEAIDIAVAEAADAMILAEPAPQATAVAVAVDDGIVEIPGAIEEIQPTKSKRGWNPFRRKQAEEIVPVAVGGTALAAGEITTTSLDAPRTVAVEAAAAPEARQGAAGSRLDKPYIQIGIFSLEANAESTAEVLRQNGVLPQIFKQESSGKTFWRVVAGPSLSKVDSTALLKKVKALGFADAYPVRG